MSRSEEGVVLDVDPLWYKDAILYELHVRAFQDSDGDGRGDFRGLTARLDYLQDLGITAIWLLPFYPSPLRDDGYDIASYTDVHPNYGTLDDFKTFLHEAHRRGLRVITEMVINHTSDQHPWFQRARRAPPGSPDRDFYVWSDSPERYREARIIFKDFEPSNWTWDHLAKAYYWHRFYHHQPDLNFDNPRVWQALFPLLDFWLELGVDGVRLDAIPYLYEREGTNCENLAETHDFLKALRRHVDEKFPGRMFLAEANQWPEDSAAYFGQGDECHTAFHFPIMPRMFMAIRMEDRFPILDILAQTPAIPDNCQWVLFLRNHDELTLEMVTDEERDYMYRAYARDPQARINLGIRRRLAPLLGNDRRRIELMNGLLFSLPGTPVIYYGDEIGMGDNIYLGDRNGVRTPMQWSSDRNAGFSRANPQSLYLPVIVDPEYHYEAVNVEAQQNNPSSLLWWMKRLIALRKRYRAFGRGSLEFLSPDNHKVLAYVRRYTAPGGSEDEERILVVANLSRFVQHAELNLAELVGHTPIELFGRVPFPAIGAGPYSITLGPHAFYWFALQPQKATAGPGAGEVPALTLRGGWERVFRGAARATLEAALPGYLKQRRWFGAKTREIRGVEMQDEIPVPLPAMPERDGAGVAPARLVLLRVDYLEGDPDQYLLPLAFAPAPDSERVLLEHPHAVVVRVRGEHEGVLYDASYDPAFGTALLDTVAAGRTLPGAAGEVRGVVNREVFASGLGPDGTIGTPSMSRGEQSNTSIVYGDQLILKLFRRLEEGVNPDLEIGRFLTRKAQFPNTPPVAGALEYSRGRGEAMTVAFVQGFAANEGTGWQYTLDALSRFYEGVLARPEPPPEPIPGETLLGRASEPAPPPLAAETIGTYLESARLLGERSAEMHLALASDPDDPSFAPEPFSTLYQRSLYQSMRTQAGRIHQALGKQLKHLPPEVRDLARHVYDRHNDVLQRFRALVERKITATRIRCHGDYHLGQVLYTGKDFLIIDFEGEPSRSLSERRLKRSPLRDVAGMLRSFHYAVFTGTMSQVAGGRDLAPGVIRSEDLARLGPWARFWYAWVSAAFLKAYLRVAAGASFLPAGPDDLAVLLDAYVLDKAVYEVGYELNHRPDWVRVPLRGILHLLGTGPAPAPPVGAEAAGSRT